MRLVVPVGTQALPRPLQPEIINDPHAQPTINTAGEVSRRADFLCNYFHAAHAKRFMLGISGSQDSTLTGRLAQLAVKELRDDGEGATFIVIRLPYGTQTDGDDAWVTLQPIQPDQRLTIDIELATVAMTTQAIDALTGSTISGSNRGNIKARMRMIT